LPIASQVILRFACGFAPERVLGGVLTVTGCATEQGLVLLPFALGVERDRRQKAFAVAAGERQIGGGNAFPMRFGGRVGGIGGVRVAAGADQQGERYDRRKFPGYGSDEGLSFHRHWWLSFCGRIAGHEYPENFALRE